MKTFNTICFLLLMASAAFAQQPMHMDTTKKPMKMNKKQPAKKMDMGDMNMDGMDMGDMKMDAKDTIMKMGMTSQYSRDIPMNRDGSGTSWVPDDTPMYA